MKVTSGCFNTEETQQPINTWHKTKPGIKPSLASNQRMQIEGLQCILHDLVGWHQSLKKIKIIAGKSQRK
jgi:hypothetical protein